MNQNQELDDIVMRETSLHDGSFSRRDFIIGTGALAAAFNSPLILAQSSDYRVVPVKPFMTANQAVAYIASHSGIDLGKYITDDARRLLTVKFGRGSPEVVYVGVNDKVVVLSDQVHWARTAAGVSMFKYQTSKQRHPHKIDVIFPGDELLLDLTKLTPEERERVKAKFPHEVIDIPIYSKDGVEGLRDFSGKYFASIIAQEKAGISRLPISQQRIDRYVQNMESHEFMARLVTRHICDCIYEGFIDQGIQFRPPSEGFALVPPSREIGENRTGVIEEMKLGEKPAGEKPAIIVPSQVGKHTLGDNIGEAIVRFGYSFRDPQKSIPLDYHDVPAEDRTYKHRDLRNVAITPIVVNEGHVYDIRINAPLATLRSTLQNVLGQSNGERAFNDMLRKTQTRPNRVYEGIRDISTYFGIYRPDRPYDYGDVNKAHELYTKLQPLSTVVNLVTEQVVPNNRVFRDFHANPQLKFQNVMLQATKFDARSY